jgi:hypothetical protein
VAEPADLIPEEVKQERVPDKAIRGAGSSADRGSRPFAIASETLVASANLMVPVGICAKRPKSADAMNSPIVT